MLTPPMVFAEYEARFAALRAEVDAERAHADRLALELRKVLHEEVTQCGNELGEDYVQCDRCDATQWGGKDTNSHEEIDHNSDCIFAALQVHDERRKGA